MRRYIYKQVNSLGYSKAYIGKTERNLATRLSENSDPL